MWESPRHRAQFAVVWNKSLLLPQHWDVGLYVFQPRRPSEGLIHPAAGEALNPALGADLWACLCQRRAGCHLYKA